MHFFLDSPAAATDGARISSQRRQIERVLEYRLDTGRVGFIHDWRECPAKTSEITWGWEMISAPELAEERS
jgi:hypothetical protein